MPAKDKVVVIAGALGALGNALAARFAHDGAAAVVLADIDGEGAAQAAQRLGRRGVTAAGLRVDVADATSVEGLIDDALDRFARVDVMINNVGVLCPTARVADQALQDWELAVSVNLMGTVHGIAAVVEPMRAAGGGSIINTASVAGLTAWSHSAPYGTTKAAIIHLTKVAALEYARDRIRVNCVCPGMFASPMADGLPAKAITTAQERHPLGIGEPEDLPGAYSYLAGDDSRWTTGAVIVVDGGYALP